MENKNDANLEEVMNDHDHANEQKYKEQDK